MTVHRRTLGIVCSARLVCSVVVNPGPTAGVEVGRRRPASCCRAPPALNISLSDFKGKVRVPRVLRSRFLSDLSSILSARKANYKSFEDLGVQVLAVSANTTFSQQTFAES
jgi:peroxiredoxin